MFKFKGSSSIRVGKRIGILFPVDDFHQFHRVFHGRFLMHAVAEVEDEAGTVPDLVEYGFGLAAHFVFVGQQNRGVEVSLKRAVFADHRPSRGGFDAPVCADAVPAGRRHRGQKHRVSRREVNDRRFRRVAFHLTHDPGRVRLDETNVIPRREAADPRVEKLHDVGPRVDLGAEVRADRLGKPVMT